MSHKYLLPVAFSLGGSITASAQLKEGVLEPPLPPPPVYVPVTGGEENASRLLLELLASDIDICVIGIV